MESASSIRTYRWTRSPRGEILGVATGLAEWRGFPPGLTRLTVFLIILFTGVFPGTIVYLICAVILPLQTSYDVISDYEGWAKRERNKHTRHNARYEDASYRETNKEEKSTEDLKREYENLKKKVEEMESQVFDREKDWDARFNSGEKDKC